MHNSNNFKLYGGNDAFADRQKKLFDQLSIAEQECSRTRSMDSAGVPTDMEYLYSNEGPRPPRDNKKRKSETRQFRGKESIFKRPERPAPRNNCRSIPDYHKNPHKWMKYSLDDVSTDDMTDRSNARTAFAFLKELKARRSNGDLEMEQDSDSTGNRSETEHLLSEGSAVGEAKQSTTGFRFKKPQTARVGSRQNSVIVDREEKPVFLSTKVLMPEYVVGQKQKQKPKRRSKEDKDSKVTLAANRQRTRELKLNHLVELDDDGDETF